MSSRHDPATTIADMLDNIARIESYLAGMARLCELSHKIALSEFVELGT